MALDPRRPQNDLHVVRLTRSPQRDGKGGISRIPGQKMTGRRRSRWWTCKWGGTVFVRLCRTSRPRKMLLPSFPGKWHCLEKGRVWNKHYIYHMSACTKVCMRLPVFVTLRLNQVLVNWSKWKMIQSSHQLWMSHLPLYFFFTYDLQDYPDKISLIKHTAAYLHIQQLLATQHNSVKYSLSD